MANQFLTDYEDFVSGLISDLSKESFQSFLGTGGLGLAGEAGEVADIAKKVLYHGMDWTPEVCAKVKKELGDIMWYVALTARHVCNSSIEEIINLNIEKLSARYTTGKFSKEEFMKKELAKEDFAQASEN